MFENSEMYSHAWVSYSNMGGNLAPSLGGIGKNFGDQMTFF